MNNSNFTAQEIKALQETSSGVFSEIIAAITAVQDACSTMSSIVASGDSNLSGKWASVADSIGGPIRTADSSFTYLGDILNSYVEQTVSNEDTAVADLNAIDQDISALGSAAAALVDLGSAVGVPSDVPNIIYAPPTPSFPTIEERNHGVDDSNTGPAPVYAPPKPGGGNYDDSSNYTTSKTPDGAGVGPSPVYAPPGGGIGGGSSKTPDGAGVGPSPVYAPPGGGIGGGSSKTPDSTGVGPSPVYAPPRQVSSGN